MRQRCETTGTCLKKPYSLLNTALPSEVLLFFFLSFVRMVGPAVLIFLKRQCAGHHAVATRRSKEVVDVFAASPDPDPVKLEQMKQGLHDTLDTLKQLDADILDKVNPGDIDKEIEDSVKVRDELFATMAQIDRALMVIPSAMVPRVSEAVTQEYDGTLTTSTPFWDAYKTAIHSNHSLSSVEKFTYLQTLLEGKAKEAISGLSLTDANYTAAIGILERKFGDKELIIAAHMDKLMSLEAVHSDYHIADLRRLYDRTESSIRALDVLGVKAESYGALLMPIFIGASLSEPHSGE